MVFQSIHLKRTLSLFITFLLLLNALFVPVAFAADAAAVASWDCTSAPASASAPATGGAMATGAALTSSSGLTPAYSTSSLSVSGWNDGTNTKYWQLSLSTKGYENLTLAAKTRSSGTGPRDFKVVYSIDNGATWADAPGSDYAIASTTLKNNMPTVSLPSNAANVDSLLIRFVMTSNISSRAGTGSYSASETAASGGTSNINNVSIMGTPAAPIGAVDAVFAAPSGGAIAEESRVELTCPTDGAAILVSINDGAYEPYDPAARVTLAKLPAKLAAYGTKSGLTDGVVTTWNFTKAQAAAVIATPNGGAVEAGKHIALACATPGAAIRYSTDGGKTWQEYTADIVLASLPATIQAYAAAEGMADGAVSTFSYTEKTGGYNLYFGQLHSHTTNSDGIGSLDDAFGYAKNTAKVDFLAVTDHSNSFDNASSCSMADGSKSTKWLAGRAAADRYTDGSFVGIYAYEMTWSNGTGHINTFNTPGFETRENQVYKNPDGLQQYFNVLKNFPDSISQFNHPGATFGDFNDFAGYDPAIDRLMTLVEVGNGEGAVGSSGYFPSYEYYTRALDKGWHLAPTNNQDNHQGHWGNANTARTVVLADSLTRANVYDAMRNMRVYATEDNNLRIQYTLNGEVMGSVIPKPAGVAIKIALEDPDNEALGKVSVIVSGGRVAASKTLTDSRGTVEFTLDPDYAYYYIRVDEADRDIAVTAPVWIGEVDKAGIASTLCSSALPMAGQMTTITTNLYNNESDAMAVQSLEYSVGGAVIHTAGAVSPVASLGTGSYSFDYTPAAVGKIDVTVKLVAKIGGVEKTFTDVLKLNVADSALTTKVVIDAAHYNDYVTGYYAGNMTNLIAIANAEGVSAVLQTTPITDEALAGAQLLVLSPPAKKSGTANGVTYAASVYTAEELAAIKRYADRGGNVVVTALADYQDSRSDAANHSANQQNRVLEAIGAGTRLNDDEVVDYDTNPNVTPPGVAGGTPYRAPMGTYNTDSAYLNGVVSAQSYSFYSGCSLAMGPSATWLVKGWPTTFGFDSDNDGKGGAYVAAANKTIPADTGVGRGNVVALAAEKLPGGGMLFVGGTVFYSNFEVKTQLDNYTQAQNSNYNILMNILASVKKTVAVSTIAQARAGKSGDLYCVEGTVTAGKTPVDNAFFDTLYIQDATGGINIYPVSGSDIRVGQKVKVTGTLDQYQGDIELRAVSVAVTDTSVHPLAPKALSTKASMESGSAGLLVKIQGAVTRIMGQSLYINDGSGEARVFLDGYIGDGSGDAAKLGKWDSAIQTGDTVSAVGLASVDTSGPRLRVRSSAEIIRVSTPVSPPAVTLTGIAITHAPNKVNYIEGEKFDPAGMAVTASYSDGSTTPVTDYSWSPSGALTASDKTVTIMFQGQTAEQPVSVTPKLTMKLTVRDSAGKAYPGVGIKVYADESLKTLVGQGVSDASGAIQIAGLVPGVYWVKVVSVPAGYQLPNVTIPETVRAGEDNAFTLVIPKTEVKGLASNQLKSLAVSAGVLSPAFDPEKLKYTLTLSETTGTATLRPTLADPKSSLTINGRRVSSLTVSLKPGAKMTVKILVKPAAGPGAYYEVTVQRARSTAALLSALRFTNAKLNPAFQPTTTSYALSGKAGSVRISSLKLSNGYASYSMKLDGKAFAGKTISLKPGQTRTLLIVVKAQAGNTKTYTVTVSRPK